MLMSKYIQLSEIKTDCLHFSADVPCIRRNFIDMFVMIARAIHQAAKGYNYKAGCYWRCDQDYTNSKKDEKKIRYRASF